MKDSISLPAEDAISTALELQVMITAFASLQLVRAKVINHREAAANLREMATACRTGPLRSPELGEAVAKGFEANAQVIEDGFANDDNFTGTIGPVLH